MQPEYDENAEFHWYIWNNYRHALSEREHALREAATLEIKARHASRKDIAANLRKRPGYFLDAEVASIAQDGGLATFDRQCYERLLQEFADQIYINRCERCARIVASPIACTCLWCGHHWYDRRTEMMARAASSIYPKPKK